MTILLLGAVACSNPSDRSNGNAVCTPDCAERTCGDDGCGGSCGSCGESEACVDGGCSTCGNGVLDDEETCDPSAEVSCPVAELCTSEDACFEVAYTGSAATCDAVCETTQIVECISDDGCCPSGCNPGNDVDCALATCGNGQLDPGEACDAPEVPCPDSCEPTHACESAEFWGFATACTLTCMREEITACRQESDGCCPPGCTDVNDADCDPPVCGDGAITGGETCDTGIDRIDRGGCSSDCDDHRSCTVDLMNGSVDACDVSCTHAEISDCVAGDGCCPPACVGIDPDCDDVTCGDGIVDGEEGCDNAIAEGEPGACPAQLADCDDGDACTDDSLEGSGADCSARCVNEPRGCIDGDGCCSPACTPANDDDCAELALCEAYCFGAVTYCTGLYELYASEEECMDACDTMPVGREGDISGDSIQCRINHLEDAKSDPEGHCGHSARTPIDGCV